MPVQDVVEIDGNYKGLLIQYCQERGLSQPRFTETQYGTPDAPSWKVTVHYGDKVYETNEAIPGAKKGAQQIAAKQILNAIDQNRERLLTGGDKSQDDFLSELVELSIPDETLEVALPLVTSALTIANDRLGSSQPSRYRGISDEEYSRKLTQLTMRIVRDLARAADEANIKFPQK